MLESSDGMPGQMARIVSPRLPEKYNTERKCFSFDLNLRGPHIGQIRMFSDEGRRFYLYTGSEWPPLESFRSLIKINMRYSFSKNQCPGCEVVQEECELGRAIQVFHH